MQSRPLNSSLTTMKTINDIGNLIIEINNQLRGVDCSTECENEFRIMTKECRDDIYADTLAHGGKIEDPFFNFVEINDVIFVTIFNEPFEFYFIKCNLNDFINESDKIAMSDVTAFKKHLSDFYNKSVPDICASRMVAEMWMEGG